MAVRLQFEGIRCFSTKQDVVVRPLTLLVGENSSGKSTFLAIYQIALSSVHGLHQPMPFNAPPFLLGAYDQIASHRGGRAGRAKSFSITIGVEGARAGSVRATFVSRDAQPFFHSWSLAGEGVSWEVVRDNSDAALRVNAQSAKGRCSIKAVSAQAFVPLYFDLAVSRSQELEAVLTGADLIRLREAWKPISDELWAAYAFAPTRSSPQRTYDPVSPDPKPEGSHIPMLLSNISRTNGDWTALQSGLSEFGSQSGLFDHIEVVRKGKKESDPFQIGVRGSGPTVNLVDVGYGVSQVLPILVDTLQHAGKPGVFLLQQPEVHLHPRAQAELGSFFADRVGKKQRFVVETHSDHLVDRVRMEVRSGKLSPKDVSLLYFERHGQEAQIHHLVLDKHGSIINAPDGYRQFFLNEERSLLSL